MDGALGVVLRYTGEDSASGYLDFYDAARAITGFQRSLALTTHLVTTGEIIVQAPVLKGAKIYLGTLEPGSYKIPAWIAAAAIGMHSVGTADRETPLGHLIFSVYDYAVSQSLGFHVNYDESLGQSYERLKSSGTKLPPVNESKIDSLTEKIESSIIDMHRPIVWSETATKARISFGPQGAARRIAAVLDEGTYEYISTTKRENSYVDLNGRVSSYNVNTYKGRIFCETEERPVPFELSESSRSSRVMRLITRSLSENALNRSSAGSRVIFRAFRNVSSQGRLKSYFVVDVEPIATTTE